MTANNTMLKPVSPASKSRGEITLARARPMQFSLLRTREDVLRLSPNAHDLARRLHTKYDLTFLPEYFLARMGSGMRPCVVVCRQGGSIIGLMYTEERLVFGVPTGWCFGGDDMGRGLVLSEPGREMEVIRQSCNFLLGKGLHALRLRWKQPENRVVPLTRFDAAGLQGTDRMQYRPEGDWLELQEDYESFLARLGPHTRRNLRYYRRKAEAEGISFISHIDLPSYERAVDRMRDVADFPHVPERQQRDRRFFDLVGEPYLVGLQRKDGQFASILAAVRFGTHLHVLSQLNDESLRRMSISIVLRSYLIEQAIRQGCRSIHFVDGSSPMIGRYCAPIFVQTILIDHRRSPAHLIKASGARFAQSRQRKAQWVPMRLRTLLGSYYTEW